MSNPSLLQALGAESGIVCAIGAGGKKTTLYQIFAAHSGRVGLTATAFMSTFPDELDAEKLIAPEAELAAQVPTKTAQRVAYAQPSDKPGRVAGLDPEQVQAIHAAGHFDLTLVKADGARMRRIKCPAEHEPRLPPATDTTLLILSALALGRPLNDKVAHRPERVSAVTGRAIDAPIDTADLAAIFSQPHGLLQGTEHSRVIPVLNMIDTPELEAAGREVARLTLAANSRFDRFVLSSIRREGFIVDVL